MGHCYLPIHPATQGIPDLRRVTIMPLREDGVLPVFTSLGSFGDFVDRYPAENDDVRPVPRKTGWLELAEMVGPADVAEPGELVGLLEGSGVRFVVFDPEVTPGGWWRGSLGQMSLGRFRRLMARARPLMEERAAQSAANSATRVPYPEDPATGTRSLMPRLKKIVDDLRAQDEEWRV